MKRLEVRLTLGPADERVVGRLAESDRRVYFEWDREFVDDGLELAPFKLPREPGLHEHRDLAFGPLPGLFADSLPDGWGMLLMDRHFRGKGLAPATVSPLDRLAYLGTRTMGALTYHPSSDDEGDDEADRDAVDLFQLGHHAEEILVGSAIARWRAAQDFGRGQGRGARVWRRRAARRVRTLDREVRRA
jgi:serine/threonine-protein kinase HipA